MYREIFRLYEPNGRQGRGDRALEQLWVLGLLLAAILLYQMNLGSLPLRDWDEGIVAQVARDIYRGDLNWLYPTLAGEPYFNKPPLLHLLIALAYSVGGVNEWTTRFPGALLTALSVPLLYGIGREVFPRRGQAIFSSLVYLTLLPVVRHGRLAMLDGAVLCFFLLMLWCVLRSRRDLRFSLGIGIGLGLICLTKGILGLLLGAVAFIFIAWDTPRLFASWYLWNGLLLGMAPVLTWYCAQWLQYGEQFTAAHFFNQSFLRIWHPVERHGGPLWYYLLEIFKYAWPWVLFWPQGWYNAWENRNMGWAKLVLVWTGVYLVAISAMHTKLPWYVLQVYPAIALAVGALLAEVWHRFGNVGPFSPTAFPQVVPMSYRRAWVVILALLALVGWAGSIYFGILEPTSGLEKPVTLIAVALTLSATAVLVHQQDRQFVLILFWGMYVSLCLFVNSDRWVWELGEDYPVKPVAAIIERGTPKGTKVYTSHPFNRPSLNFYSDRQVIPAQAEQLKQHWLKDPHPYFLLNSPTLETLDLKPLKRVETASGWTLVTR